MSLGVTLYHGSTSPLPQLQLPAMPTWSKPRDLSTSAQQQLRVTSSTRHAHGPAAVHDEPANDEQNGHPVTSRSAEQTTGLQVLKPRSLAPTTSRTSNYWDNAAEHERVDEHATLPQPEPPMDAGENGSESSHDGTDTEKVASSSPETSSAETSRESWVVSLSEDEGQKVPGHETGEELVELLIDEAHFPSLDVINTPPRDTGITPRVGSDHARTPSPLQPVVDPSPADTTPPAGPDNEADKGFPANPTQPARGRSERSRSRSPRAQNRPEHSGQVIPQDSNNIHCRQTHMVSSSDSDAPPRAKSQRLARTPHGRGTWPGREASDRP
ncbi:hypothetical protein MRX96_003061 [Rhipicephalus microplus]